MMTTTGDFPGVRWHGHWIAADLPEFSVDPASLGGDLPPHPFTRVLRGAVPTPRGLIRVDVHGTRVRVESPVPVRFTRLDGTETLSDAGHLEFEL